MNMDCPNGLVCVDHPGTIDLSRLEPALKPLYPDLTAAQLTAALKNFATPGHQHFITDRNHGKPEWWDVRIGGVVPVQAGESRQDHRRHPDQPVPLLRREVTHAPMRSNVR